MLFPLPPARRFSSTYQHIQLYISLCNAFVFPLQTLVLTYDIYKMYIFGYHILVINLYQIYISFYLYPNN